MVTIANLLDQYDKAVHPNGGTQQIAAVAAYYRGLAYIDSYQFSHDRRVFEMAMLEFTRAIELTNGDDKFKYYALLNRAGTYNLLEDYSAALTDVEAAERFGTFNLHLLATVKGQVLIHLCRSRNDLRQANELLTSAITQGGQTPFLFRARAETRYGLGDFAGAIEDYRRVLGMYQQSFSLSDFGTYFAIMILSYLQLGDMEAALKSSAELAQRTGDSRAMRIYQIVEANRADPQAALAQVRQAFSGIEPCRR
jgi:tetratricopeptide (TPR) repeat protein